MKTFGEFPKLCPKCGRGYERFDPRDQWFVEFHASHNGVPWSCYERDKSHIEGDHLHVECRECRYSFPMAPKDA